MAFFTKEGLFSAGVIEKGLDQIYEKLADETLDNPNAPTVLTKILEAGKQGGWITQNYQPTPQQQDQQQQQPQPQASTPSTTTPTSDTPSSNK